jgi:signal transduction histidine kinase
MTAMDLRTLALVVTIISVLQAVVMGMLYALAPGYRGTRLWLISMVLAAVATGLIALRGHIPGFFSLILANTLSVAGVAVMVEGIAQFLGRESTRWRAVAAALVVVVLLSWLAFSYRINSVSARVTVLFLSTAVLYARGAVLLWAGASRELRGSARFTACVLAGYATWLLVRLGSNLLFPPPLPMQAPINFLAPLVLLIQGLLITAGFAGLLIQRVLGDLRAAQENERASLEAAASQLGQQVAERTGQLQATVEKLEGEIEVRRGMEQKLRHYSRQLVGLQEAERAHLARELHDEVGQMLTGLNVVLEIGARGNTSTLQRQIQAAQAIVNDLTSQVRQLSLDLRPSILDDLGLLPALSWHLKRFTAQTQVAVEFQHSVPDITLAPESAITAYRIVQEALTNIARYAPGASAMLQLWVVDTTLYIQISDNGPGFDLEATLASSSTRGLAGMRERVNLVDGHFSIETAPGAGVHITAEIPLHRENNSYADPRTR